MTIRLKILAVSTSSFTAGVAITLTSTISTASQIFRRMLPATSNPGTGANCKRSTPVKSTSWPMLAAVPRAPLMASIARYRVYVSVKLAERNGRTERVWLYPSACSMGIMCLRFELFHQVDAGVRAPSPSGLWPPTRAENVAGERERDGVREASGSSAGALGAEAAKLPNETAGMRALAAVVGCGAARGVEIMGCT